MSTTFMGKSSLAVIDVGGVGSATVGGGQNIELYVPRRGRVETHSEIRGA
jgi:hypothetical protein